MLTATGKFLADSWSPTLNQLLANWEAECPKQQCQQHENQRGQPHVSADTVLTGEATPAAAAGPWYEDAEVPWGMTVQSHADTWRPANRVCR